MFSNLFFVLLAVILSICVFAKIDKTYKICKILMVIGLVWVLLACLSNIFVLLGFFVRLAWYIFKLTVIIGLIVTVARYVLKK